MTATEEQQAGALLAAINAKLDVMVGKFHAYELDDATAVRADHVQFMLSRRFGGNARGSGEVTTSTSWRIYTRYVAKSVTNARVLRDKVRVALEDVAVPVGGDTTTPIEFESNEPIGADDGWFSGADFWTYVL